MKVAELLEARRRNWQQLEQLCVEMEGRSKKALGAGAVSRFAALYRAACADLALADAYQLPPNTVQYLHQLVGRAHNQLYRSRMFALAAWGHTLLVDVPQRIFNDRCVQLMFCLFWFIFIASAFLAANTTVFPHYTEGIIGSEYVTGLEEMYSQKIEDRPPEERYAMAAFYIYNNTSIGLKCFVFGLLVVPGLYITVFNAALLGAAFGHMLWNPDANLRENFRDFVTAHGPFELTAIVLSAGAGLRLGMSLVLTKGFSRIASLKKNAIEAMPLMGAAMLLFFMAALIEGFLSPSGVHYFVKAGVAILSSGLLMFYFVILGFPRRRFGAIG